MKYGEAVVAGEVTAVATAAAAAAAAEAVVVVAGGERVARVCVRVCMYV